VININLLPGSTRRPKRRLPQFSLKRSSAPQVTNAKPRDTWAIVAVVAWIAAPALVGWMFFSTSTQRSHITVAIEGARLDSTRYAEIRAANAILLARQDTIAQKLEIIQEIDASRYTWAHIVDEVSRAVPEYTWLVNIFYLSQTSALDSPQFMIEGRTGNTFALTQFMQDLESSPFVRNVTLLQTDQIREGDKELYSFTLQAVFQDPPADVIRTVPIFSRESD
jgi:Tfp pilus assembly protein PilN